MKRLEHGGNAQKGKRKTARPFNPKLPIHVVFRSEKAKNRFSLNHQKFNRKIEILLHKLGLKYDIQVYEFANSGNHLHLILRSKAKLNLQNFLREFAGRVALLVYPGKGKFWTSLVYTKLARWGKQFKNLCTYVIQNHLEALGIISYQERNTSQKKFFQILYSS